MYGTQASSLVNFTPEYQVRIQNRKLVDVMYGTQASSLVNFTPEYQVRIQNRKLVDVMYGTQASRLVNFTPEYQVRIQHMLIFIMLIFKKVNYLAKNVTSERDPGTRFSTSDFSSTIPGPLIHGLKPFAYGFVFA
jgi:hypothetical protein